VKNFAEQIEVAEKAEPPHLTTFLAGQPRLMSTAS